jgi:hypothetical protein
MYGNYQNLISHFHTAWQISLHILTLVKEIRVLHPIVLSQWQEVLQIVGMMVLEVSHSMPTVVFPSNSI